MTGRAGGSGLSGWGRAVLWVVFCAAGGALGMACVPVVVGPGVVRIPYHVIGAIAGACFGSATAIFAVHAPCRDWILLLSGLVLTAVSSLGCGGVLAGLAG